MRYMIDSFDGKDIAYHTEESSCDCIQWSGMLRADPDGRVKIADGKLVVMTGDEIAAAQAEMEAEMAAQDAAPSQLDEIQAQVLYTALMTDTLMEE